MGGKEQLIEPDMISNQVRNKPAPAAKGPNSVRAADNWVTMREGEDSYNATGAYGSKCCHICSPAPGCVKSRCKSVCKKACGPAFLVPAKAVPGVVSHHMVKGFDSMHSPVVAKQVQKPNPLWAQFPLKAIPNNGAVAKKEEKKEEKKEVKQEEKKEGKKEEKEEKKEVEQEDEE